MRPLIDGDILLHELGWSGEFPDKESGDRVLLPFESVRNMLDEKIRLICLDVGASQPPTIFFSSSEEIVSRVNRFRRWQGEPELTFVPNFRYEVAVTKPYKGTRKNPKPFHFYNILFYLMSEYDWVLSDDGLEADDMMCIEQISNAKEFGVKIDTHAGPVLVDYEDWLRYSRTTFIKDSKGYFVNDTGKGDTRSVWLLHRDIMGNPEGMVVDHINGDTHDNRKYNLRVCSAKENVRNSKPQKGSSAFKGVYYDKNRDQWTASIKVDGKSKHLGRYSMEEEAAKSYDEAAKLYFGEYARLNFESPVTKPFKETIICSRDKDLRICPLKHFSWECGGQASIGPTETDRIGWIDLKIKETVDPVTKKVKKEKSVVGYGLSFFYAQMLMGDTADNIPGLPRYGPAKAYELLGHLRTEDEIKSTVKDHYKFVMGKEKGKDFFLEQANLLWMVQEKGKGYEL